MKRLRRVAKGALLGVTLLVVLWAGVTLALRLRPNPVAATECVALVHGLARSPASWDVTAAYLRQAGYHVVVPSYASTTGHPADLAAQIWDQVAQGCADKARIHAVTHSMGGIMMRVVLADGQPARLGRVVMLAPPNHGSGIVDAFGDTAWFQWLNGPAGSALGTGAEDLPQSLPPADFPLGVIAGRVSLNPFYSRLVAGRDDGKVSVDSTKLAGMDDHIVIAASHSFIMNNPLTLVQTQHFLRHGRFEPGLGWGQALRRVLRREG